MKLEFIKEQLTLKKFKRFIIFFQIILHINIVLLVMEIEEQEQGL